MNVDREGKLFENRRKDKDRRKNNIKVKTDRRKGTDRRDEKNSQQR